MSIPAYPAYRDSGVAWLGQVPAHWEVMPLKRAARLCTDRAADRSFPVGLEHIESWTGRLIEAETEFEGDGVVFRPGDILFGKLRPYLAKAWLADRPGEAVGDFHVIRPLPPHVPEFLQRVLLSREAISLIDGSTYGSKMPRASWEFIGSLAVPFPPPAEQRAIAAFLDRECGKIDALVAEQERLIALLKEKRQAVISHAVTKGLDPTAPMKDSGVAWLGPVPAHWEVKRLKFLVRSGTSISYGIVQPGEHQDDGVPFVQTTNMSSGDFDIERLQRTTPEIAAAYPRTCLEGGEVLLGIRASIGAAHIAPDRLRGVNLSRGVARIVCNESVSSDFLVAALRSGAVAEYWALMRQGSTFNEVSIETVRELAIAMPPPHEQKAIACFVEVEARAFDTLIAEAERAIALLKERRAALISAAVTGRIDVRGLVPAEEAKAA